MILSNPFPIPGKRKSDKYFFRLSADRRNLIFSIISSDREEAFQQKILSKKPNVIKPVKSSS